MSEAAREPVTVPKILARKGGKPIVCVTAYTTPFAALADKHCDMILVGDSLGMVIHGLPDTVGVTMEMMVLHGQAVRRGVKDALIIVDLPFGSYEASHDQAMRNAARLMSETGCNAVKLEGGQPMAKTIEFLTARGIPVVGHVGLTPQHVNTFGGFKLQGRGIDARRVLDDAKAVAQAGAFSVVVEKVPDALADKITSAVTIPTIGIGASAKCDGQILVMDDILGIFTAFKPRFAKRYAELGALADKAIGDYAAEVRARTFPSADNVYQENLKK